MAFAGETRNTRPQGALPTHGKEHRWWICPHRAQQTPHHVVPTGVSRGASAAAKPRFHGHPLDDEAAVASGPAGDGQAHCRHHQHTHTGHTAEHAAAKNATKEQTTRTKAQQQQALALGCAPYGTRSAPPWRRSASDRTREAWEEGCSDPGGRGARPDLGRETPSPSRPAAAGTRLPHGGSGTGGAGEKDESRAAASTAAWRRAAAWRGGGRGGVEKGVEEKGPAAAILAAARTSAAAPAAARAGELGRGRRRRGVLGSARVAPEDDAGVSHSQGSKVYLAFGMQNYIGSCRCVATSKTNSIYKHQILSSISIKH
ncbi:uncharacterized protein LOC120647742 [Panicum virgatum]|uniref:uncharacterized protein LOC120647742 n=1 Tax=Panicum virgatum TaxID=38727 RepID=UPI0019D65F8A|nr:uncharacterized protein LOC120647742 [Panicum virgatum]